MLRPTSLHYFCAGMLVVASAIGSPVLCAADTEYTNLDQLPAPVQVALKQEAKGAKLTKLEREERGGVVIYTGEIPGSKAGTVVEFFISADGKLLKNEIEDISTDVTVPTSAITTLGDLSAFRTLGIQTMQLVAKKDFKSAVERITDLESAWDKAEEVLRATNGADWKILDKVIDKALGQVRADNPDADGCAKALKALIGLCPNPAANGK